MSQFGITKIMDGIFVADDSFVDDLQFLITNKVSHIIVWSSQRNQYTCQDSQIKSLIYPKTVEIGLLPDQSQLNRVAQFIQQSKQECLCCLICSEIQSQAAMLLSSYLMKKFQWDLKTAFDFLQLRLNFFNPRVEIVEQLQDFQLYLQTNILPRNLRTLQFRYQFLLTYQTEDDEEKLLLNTIKNVLSENQNYKQAKKNYNKRRKRVQWFDKIRSSTSLTSINPKYAVYNNRNLSLKAKNQLVDKQALKLSQMKLSQEGKSRLLKKKSQVLSYGGYMMDDLEFQSLKQLSRTKIYESKLKGSLRKRGSLKLSNQGKRSKQNLQNLISQNTGPLNMSLKLKKKATDAQLKGSDSQTFFKNLKLISSKLKINYESLNA